MTSELRPCPNHEPLLEPKDHLQFILISGMWRIRCKVCGRTNGMRSTKPQAISNWDAWVNESLEQEG